jgi:hypothetical protein
VFCGEDKVWDLLGSFLHASPGNLGCGGENDGEKRRQGGVHSAVAGEAN